MTFKYLSTAIIAAALLAATPALAKWQVKERPKFVGGGFQVLDPETGRQMDTKFRTKKAAKAAAKVLNAADDLAEENDGG